MSSDEKKNAQEEIKEINNEKNAIMIAENLVKTKGYKDIIITKIKYYNKRVECELK